MYIFQMSEKEFILKHVFNNVGKLEKDDFLFSPVNEHCGVEWKIRIIKINEHLGMHLYTNVNGNQEIHADRTLKIFSKNKEKTHSMDGSRIFNRIVNDTAFAWGWDEFIEWKTLEDQYLDNGKLEVEIEVKINKMVGFSRKELRSFGEDMKKFSDVILKVKERKFHVLKLYLSSYSPYFETLFLGKFQEAEKSEIELKNVGPQDFQYYLEVLYGENGIDDQTVQGILSVADMFDTPKIVKKCEEFLVKESEKGLKRKLELAGSYRLGELKKLCMEQIQSRADIRSVMPENSLEMDKEILAELLEKSLTFN
ncbi:unnamed protein product [Caenorhabditis nigoni]